MPISRAAFAGILLLLVLLLQGCGRKGPLFMSQEPLIPVPVAQAKPEPAQSAPVQTIQSPSVPNQSETTK